MVEQGTWSEDSALFPRFNQSDNFNGASEHQHGHEERHYGHGVLVQPSAANACDGGSHGEKENDKDGCRKCCWAISAIHMLMLGASGARAAKVVRARLIGRAFLIPKLDRVETVFLSVLTPRVVTKALNPGLPGVPLARLMNEHFLAVGDATDDVVPFELPLRVNPQRPHSMPCRGEGPAVRATCVSDICTQSTSQTSGWRKGPMGACFVAVRRVR
jgi:hypothetical protein